MLDAPFASLEADYVATLARRDREQPHTSSDRAAIRPLVVLALLARISS